MQLDNNFFVLAPLAVTETQLLSGTPDAENQIYAGGTTYAKDDEVWSGGKAYRSKVAGNTGNNPSSSPTKWEDLGQVDEGAEVYAGGTTYSLDAYAVYEGQLWRSAVAGNAGNTPSVSEVKWTRQGATNRLKAFDQALEDPSTSPGILRLVLQFTDFVSQIAILRASGATVQIKVTDSVEGLVYDKTYLLIEDAAIIDAWTYCFEDFIQNDTLLVEDLPPYSNAEIEITITSDEIASVGQIVCGNGKAFAVVVVNTGAGIEDYSVKERDDFNRSIVVEYPYSDTIDFVLKLDKLRVGYVKRQLALRRALPTLYYMSGGANYGLIAYGFFKRLNFTHSTPVVAEYALEIEGLG